MVKRSPTEPANGDKGDWRRIDTSDPAYASLASYARKVGKLMECAVALPDADLIGCLDDLLGAIYSLILARELGFEDRTDRPADEQAVLGRAADIASGMLRSNGKWMAGFYFNGALFRVAGVFHRLLKLASGERGTRLNVHELKARLNRDRHNAGLPEWRCERTAKVHAEVNELKHQPGGVYYGRRATYDDARSAVGELIELLGTARDPASGLRAKE